MPNKLRNPADHVHRDCDSVDFRAGVFGRELVGGGGGGEQNWCGADACEVGGEEEVEGRVGECGQSAEVEGEVEACEEGGCADG